MEPRKYFLLILGATLIGFLVWYFSNIFLYILIAGILSLIGQPINHFFGKLKISDSISAALTLLSLLLIFFLLAIFFIPLITEEACICAKTNAGDGTDFAEFSY